MAWTITETMYKTVNVEAGTGRVIYIVKLACTADANAVDYDLTAATMTRIKGGYIYMVKTRPGAGGDAPGAAYLVQIQDELDDVLLSMADRSTSAVEFEAGSATIGLFPPITDTISLVVNDQVGNANKFDIYFYVTKN